MAKIQVFFHKMETPTIIDDVVKVVNDDQGTLIVSDDKKTLRETFFSKGIVKYHITETNLDEQEEEEK